MRRFRYLCAIALLVAGTAAAAFTPIEFRDAAERERFQALATELRCLVCQNQSLADSDAPLAADLRREVLKLMRAGNSNEQIRQYLVERYGDFVLYDPPVKPATWALWFGPAILLAGGAVGLAVAIRRRSARPDDDPDA